MSKTLCACGNPITYKENRPCTWCEICGERMFPEYAALAHAVAALKQCGAGSVSPEVICSLHNNYFNLALDENMLRMGFEVDFSVSKRLLCEAAEVANSAMLWYVLGNTYEGSGILSRIEWFERGVKCAQYGSDYHRKCLIMAARLHEQVGSRSYSLSALGHYSTLFALDPSNAELAMILYRGYKAAWEDLGNDSYYSYKEHYLRIANSLGSYDARSEINRIQAAREAQEIIDSERRRREAEAIANEIYEEMFESHGTKIIRRN